MFNSNLNWRTVIAFLHDTCVILIAWILAFWLRFNLSIPTDYWPVIDRSLPWVILLNMFVFWGTGLYHRLWRFASIPDLKQILIAIGIGSLIVPSFFYLIYPINGLPRSVFILTPILLALMMAGDRLLFRFWREHREHQQQKQAHDQHADLQTPVLIIGAGNAAVSLIRELKNNPQWKILGFLDDDPMKIGKKIHNIPVLDSLQRITVWARKLHVKNVIIAMPSASYETRRAVTEICQKAKIDVFSIPSFMDMITGKVTISQLHKVNIEDLLGRAAIKLDLVMMKTLITNQVVLITGAGGSIGSELCRQAALFQPKKLIFFELNEFALYQLEQEFREHHPHVAISCLIGDVKNGKRLDQIFSTYRPNLVFHAAAYKHVPLMEEGNTWEALQNNVYGTYQVAQTAIRHGVTKFVMISTDKAVNPTNVMGASKRLAEMVCQALQAGQTQEQNTRFVMVRFGNVLGSAGSVIPKFQAQIARGGPITVTHPEIIRYFMSIPEAVQLVLQAAGMSNGDEILVLDMGEPIKIVDLAKDMIRLSGFSEDQIKIVFTGLRPGEKLYEELLADDELTLPTAHEKVRIARARQINPEWITPLLTWLTAYEWQPDDQTVKTTLQQWVPEYKQSLH